MRSFGGIAAGILLGFLAMTLVSFLGGLIFPIPVDAGIHDPVAQATQAFPHTPTGARLFIALAWLAGGFAAAATAILISKRLWTGWVAAGIIAFFSVLNIFILPLPAWMQVASAVLPLLGAVLARHVAYRPPPAPEMERADA